MARRTAYINLRAGLLTTLLSFLALVGSNYVSHGWTDIPSAEIVVLVIGYALALGVVLVLDYRLQNRPLDDG